MGSFSWNKADSLTGVLNVSYWSKFKFLIPKEFGGGFIKDNYSISPPSTPVGGGGA